MRRSIYVPEKKCNKIKFGMEKYQNWQIERERELEEKTRKMR